VTGIALGRNGISRRGNRQKAAQNEMGSPFSVWNHRSLSLLSLCCRRLAPLT
jgi:hypothetical protein